MVARAELARVKAIEEEAMKDEKAEAQDFELEQLKVTDPAEYERRVALDGE